MRAWLLASVNVTVRRGRVDIHRDQGIVERFNRALVERLFGHKYAVEMRLPEGERSREWVARLPAVVTALDNEVTRLTGKKPSEAIKAKTVAQKPSSWFLVAQSVSRSKSFPPVWAFAIYTNLGSWREAAAGRLTPCESRRLTSLTGL